MYKYGVLSIQWRFIFRERTSINVNQGNTQSRRKEYSDSTRKALLRSAQKLFVSKGYHATSLDAVAAHARLTKGALYHHFKNKRSLFEALVIEAQKQLSHKAAEAGSKTKGHWNRLLIGIESFLVGCSEPEYRRLVVEDGIAVLGLERWREIDEAQHAGPVSAMLEILVDNGIIENRSISLMGHIILAMVTEAAVCIATADDPQKTQQEAIYLIRNVLNSFRIDKT